jgi:hypothetical protein
MIRGPNLDLVSGRDLDHVHVGIGENHTSKKDLVSVLVADAYFFFSYNYNALICYALLTSVRFPLSVLPTVRPMCFADRSPMCCANHGFIN